MPAGLRSGTANDGYLQINGVDVHKITTQGIVTPPVGQCRFSYVSTTVCRLTPYQGNQITINGLNYTIPSAGVDLSSTGIANNTNYFVYAYISSGTTIALEASTTGHSTDTATGVEIKTSDASRTLVGMVRGNGTNTFGWTTSLRYVLSWFNRKPTIITNVMGSNFVTSAASIQTMVFAEFLTWGNESVIASTMGAVQNNTSGAVSFIAMTLDATQATPTNYAQASAANGYGAFSSAYSINTGTEGYHYIAGGGWCNSGTSTFLSGLAVSTTVWM